MKPGHLHISTGAELFSHRFIDGITCTLLPPARVTGRTWLIWVIETSSPQVDLSEDWGLGTRFRVFHHGTSVEPVEGGGRGNDERWVDHYAFTESLLEIVLYGPGFEEVARVTIDEAE